MLDIKQYTYGKFHISWSENKNGLPLKITADIHNKEDFFKSIYFWCSNTYESADSKTFKDILSYYHIDNSIFRKEYLKNFQELKKELSSSQISSFISPSINSSEWQFLVDNVVIQKKKSPYFDKEVIEKLIKVCPSDISISYLQTLPVEMKTSFVSLNPSHKMASFILGQTGMDYKKEQIEKIFEANSSPDVTSNILNKTPKGLKILLSHHPKISILDVGIVHRKKLEKLFSDEENKKQTLQAIISNKKPEMIGSNLSYILKNCKTTSEDIIRLCEMIEKTKYKRNSETLSACYLTMLDFLKTKPDLDPESKVYHLLDNENILKSSSIVKQKLMAYEKEYIKQANSNKGKLKTL